MPRLALLLAIWVAFAAAEALADPVPYADLRPATEGKDWCPKAAASLVPGAMPLDCQAAPQALRLNNPFGLVQDPGHPWRGTPKFDGHDGASNGGAAVFSDPRWSARAMAIELRDDYAAGRRSARQIADWLGSECRRLGGPDCAADLAPALAKEVAGTPTEDLRLFGAGGEPSPNLRTVMHNLADRAMGPGYEPTPELIEVGVEAVSGQGLDQSKAGFEAWLRRRPGRAEEVSAFTDFLADKGLQDLFPAYQLMRSASDFKGCGEPFRIPPREDWDHLAGALALIKTQVIPALPPLEAKSVSRSGFVNLCAGGAEMSAHRDSWAVDLVPTQPFTRPELMARLCRVYVAEGPASNMGLGFYGGVRFHIDTRSFRSWASHNGAAYGPCAADGSVNPEPDVPPPPEPWPPPPPSR